jgi:arylsulfatase
MAKRNLLVILCDQLRPDFLTVYGGRGVPTPNIERLAAMGVVFERAITVSTVCAPSRASMMTGRYVSDHQVWSNDLPFREGLEYLAQRMGALGYATGAFGKLHHYPARDSKGFHVFEPMEEGRLGEQEPYFQWLKARHPEITGIWNHQDHTFDFSEEEYYEHWIASRAIEFIRAQREQPFLAWVSFQGPHTPFDPPREVKGSCDPSALPRPLVWPKGQVSPDIPLYREVTAAVPGLEAIMKIRLAYAEMIVAIDRQIGRLLDELERLGLLETTTIVFSSDHGDMLGDYGQNQKGPMPYRGQLDIPLILANHPAIAAGTRSRQLAGNLDLPGTCLDIAGADRLIGFSRSLLDLAQPSPRQPRTVNFSEFCNSIKTVEDERYRFSYYPFTGQCQLFDRVADPDERRNLADDPAHAPVRIRMLQHIIDFLALNGGVRVEAHDFVPRQQDGVATKLPGYQHHFPVLYPLNAREVELLTQAGLDASYNDFCRNKPVTRHYAKPYWNEPTLPPGGPEQERTSDR